MNEFIRVAGMLLTGVEGQAFYNLLPGVSAKTAYVLIYGAIIVLSLGVTMNWSLTGYWLSFLICCICGRVIE